MSISCRHCVDFSTFPESYHPGSTCSFSYQKSDWWNTDVLCQVCKVFANVMAVWQLLHSTGWLTSWESLFLPPPPFLPPSPSSPPPFKITDSASMMCQKPNPGEEQAVSKVVIFVCRGNLRGSHNDCSTETGQTRKAHYDHIYDVFTKDPRLHNPMHKICGKMKNVNKWTETQRKVGRDQDMVIPSP